MAERRLYFKNRFYLLSKESRGNKIFHSIQYFELLLNFFKKKMSLKNGPFLLLSKLNKVLENKKKKKFFL